MAKKVVEAVAESQAVEDPAARDYLMWVGAIYYPTVDSYIDEANRIGPCKRIGKLPNGLTPGKSRVFLAHDDGINGEGFIFGYFIPTEIQCLAASEDDIPEYIFDRVTWVSEWFDEEERECGTRHEGLYLVGFADGDESEDEKPQPKLTTFKRPRILEVFEPGRKHFRGLLEVDWGDKVIKAKKDQTMIPPSRGAHEPIPAETPWTPEDEVWLMGFAAEYQDASIQKIAQLVSYKTGRPKSSVAYKYRLMLKAAEEYEEADNEE